MGWISLAIGLVAVFLGGLWLVQGLGLVVVDPILCFGDCEPLEGPSATWAVLGFIVLTLGALAIAYGLKRLGKRRPR